MTESTQRIEASILDLAPRSQSVAAVAEEEWEKQGIGFRSRAERGTGYWQDSNSSTALSNGSTTASIGGASTILADIIQQILIHDQYDRAVMEQDEQLQAKVDAARARANNEQTKQ